MTTYALATPADDAVLRALLRDNAMPAWVTMTLQREPCYFDGCDHFGRDWAVIAREGDTPVGMYACAEQPLHLNGRPTEVGYLGALRVSPQFRNRPRILRQGFASIPRFSHLRDQPLWYTAIATDNLPARRMLEANLPGMPHYQFTNELVTSALPRSRGRRRNLWRAAQSYDMAHLCDFYNQHARQHQFSPALSPAVANRTGASFYMLERGGALAACMALWHQPYKQVVAQAYRRPLAALLPAYNLWARLGRRVPLPAIGQALDQTYLAFLAVAPEWASASTELLEDALALCPSDALTLGLHATHPWLPALMRTFRPLTYRTRLYAVSFDGAVVLDGRPAQPEVAVL